MGEAGVHSDRRRLGGRTPTPTSPMVRVLHATACVNMRIIVPIAALCWPGVAVSSRGGSGLCLMIAGAPLAAQGSQNARRQ